MSVIGHNKGPTMEAGQSWRRHCWGKARRDLLPRMPVEIVRQRVRRAKELGLDYKTYASVRAASGRDVVAFLFSSNALRLTKPEHVIEEARAAQLRAIRDCGRLLLASGPLVPAQTAKRLARENAVQFDAVHRAPEFTDSWSALRDKVRLALAEGEIPAAAVVMVGDTGFERDWSEAARLGAYLPADRVFGTLALEVGGQK